jgi:hypothetical protein
MSGLPRIAGSLIKGALYGGAYAGHKQGEENEASSESAEQRTRPAGMR